MLTASKILARPKDSGQRMLLRTSGCRKNVFSSQSPRKTVPGEAISAKLGVLSSGRAPATAPRGLCFQPSSKFAPRLLFDALRRTPWHTLRLDARQNVLQHAVAPLREHHAGAQRALDRRARQIGSAGAGGERRNGQALARRAIPIGGG